MYAHMKKREPIARSVPFFLYRYIMLFMQASVLALLAGDTLCETIQFLGRISHPLLRFAGHIRLLRYLMQQT